MSLKQPDGSFLVSHDMEVDARQVDAECPSRVSFYVQRDILPARYCRPTGYCDPRARRGHSSFCCILSNLRGRIRFLISTKLCSRCRWKANSSEIPATSSRRSPRRIHILFACFLDLAYTIYLSLEGSPHDQHPIFDALACQYARGGSGTGGFQRSNK